MADIENEKEVEKSEPCNNKVIWLYSAHPIVLRQRLVQILGNTASGIAELRLQLGLDFNQPLIPILPEIRDRVGYIQYLCGLKSLDAVIIIAGELADIKHKKIQNLYQGTAVWIQPPERDYYIQTMSDEDAISYRQVQKIEETWRTFLGENFETVQKIK